MFDYNRRRSSAGFILALGAAALANAPLASAAPAGIADAGLPSWSDSFKFGRRGSAPDIYERSESGWRNSKNASGVIKRRSTAPVVMARRSMDRVLRARQGSCLDSTYTEDDINTLLSSGGAGTRVQLCPGATLELEGPIIFTAANQEISTQGYPTDSSRGCLQVTGSDQDTAIYNNCDQCIGTSLRNIEVDGARPSLGWMSNGGGLIEMGGNAYYQTVDNCHIHDPRGWTALHVIEGYQDSCKSQVITNNQVGPSGTAPNNAQQFHVVMNEFKEFISTPPRIILERQVQAPGRWADGISVACRNTTVAGNTVTGATDGGIVLFGSPSSTVTGNTIITRDNTQLGGINLVDHGPFAGDYSGVMISGNTILADNAMLKVGIATGLMAWGSYNHSDYRTQGATIQNNVFKSNGGSGYFGYGIAVGGHNNAVVNSNNYNGALFGGTPSYACAGGGVIPPFQAAIWSPYTTSGGTYQSGITSLVDFAFLICTMPCQYDATCASTMQLTGPVPVADASAPANTTSTSTSSSSTLSTSTSTSTLSTSTSTSSSTSTTTSSSTSTTPSSTSTSISTSSSTSTSTSTSTSASKSTSTKASSTTSKSTSTSKISSTTSQATLALARGKATATTSSKPAALVSTTSSKAATVAKTTSANKVAVAGKPTQTLSLSRGRGTKRALEEEEEENVAPPMHAPRKRSEDVVRELEERLLVYRDWILPGAVRTPRAKRSYLENNGFDKRQVLADEVYWME